MGINVKWLPAYVWNFPSYDNPEFRKLIENSYDSTDLPDSWDILMDGLYRDFADSLGEDTIDDTMSMVKV